MMGFLLITFYIAMAGAAFVVEALFGVLGLVPSSIMLSSSKRRSAGITRRGSISCS